MFAAIYCASMIFPALDSILKERLFRSGIGAGKEGLGSTSPCLRDVLVEWRGL